jgi:hypothetical protein
MNDPVVVLRALAAAAKDDDGAALAALVHPTHGAWLWDHPGATVSPSVHLEPGDATPPSRRLAPSGMNDYWKERYWAHVTAGLGRGLDRLDREPAERFAPIYGDCDEDDATGGSDPRAWLVMKDDFDAMYQPLFEDAVYPFAPAISGQLVHFRSWGLDVWLAHADGRLWVAHVMVWTPCDA